VNAEGETVVRQAEPTRAHTEEMLTACGVDVDVTEGGRVVRLRPSTPQPFELDVPGDPSQAAFWIVAACIVPGSEVVVDDVYIGPARTGFLDFLRRMGADVEQVGERSLRARYSPDLHGTGVFGKDVPGLVDEIPVLAVAGAVASDSTGFVDVGELRLKESDRIATVIEALAALGATATYDDEGLVVQGGARLRGGNVHSHWDHRIAMAAAVAGLVADGTTTIDGWEAVATSYPGFEHDLETLCGS
jgi:3-phosphoshikimate 1-carboxyvinyltransferase